MASSVRVGLGVLAADTTVTDVTWSGEGTPVGAIVIATYATALDTDTADAGFSIGFTDFTTTVGVGVNAEDAAATTNTRRIHQEANILELHTVGTGTVIRSATASAITDGVRLTPGESGTAFRFMVIAFFGAEAKAFSAGDLTAQDSNFAVAHGLSAKPRMGVYAYVGSGSEDQTQASLSIGFHSDGGAITQKAHSIKFQNGQADGEGHGQLSSDRVGAFLANNGTYLESIELTANDATNTTFTSRDSSMDGDLIGLLVELTDVAVWLGTVNSPDSAAADWDETTMAFQPQAVFSILGRPTVVDTAMNDDPNAGTIGFFSTDFTTSATAGIADENAAGPTDTESRLSQGLYLAEDDSTEDYNASSPTAESTGIQFSAANITTADGTTHLWPMLAIAAAQVDVPVLNTVGPGDLAIVYDNETGVEIDGNNFGTSIPTVQLHNQDPLEVTPTVSVSQTVTANTNFKITITVDKGALADDGVFIGVTNNDNDQTTSAAITVRDDPAGPPQLRASMPNQGYTEAVAFSFDTSDYFYDSDTEASQVPAASPGPPKGGPTGEGERTILVELNGVTYEVPSMEDAQALIKRHQEMQKKAEKVAEPPRIVGHVRVDFDSIREARPNRLLRAVTGIKSFGRGS